MKSRNSSPIREAGQRTIPSTFKTRPAQPSSTKITSDRSCSCVPSVKNNPGSILSLTNFLCRKLHSASVLPFHKVEKTPLAGEEESFTVAVDCNTQNRDEQRGKKERVIEDSVFKLFNESRGGVRKRSSENVTVAPSRLECVSKQHKQNHILVLGDDPKPKRRAPGGVSGSFKKHRPTYNHYENGTGFWEPERVGVDSDEVGSTEVWEGIGSTTTLGRLDDLSTFDPL